MSPLQQGEERPALDYIQRYIRYGFYQPDEIEQIVFEEVFNGAVSRDRIRELIKVEVARHLVNQQTWPTVTDCDRLDTAFKALQTEGILALHNAGFTPSEGMADVNEQYHAAGGAASGLTGYCFYHGQDIEGALKQDKLGLFFGDINRDERRGVKIGECVRAALLTAGLQVVWSGSIKDNIIVTGFRWQRRLNTPNRPSPDFERSCNS